MFGRSFFPTRFGIPEPKLSVTCIPGCAKSLSAENAVYID